MQVNGMKTTMLLAALTALLMALGYTTLAGWLVFYRLRSRAIARRADALMRQKERGDFK